MCNKNVLRQIIKEEMGELLIEHSRSSGLSENDYLETMLTTFLPIVKSKSFKRIKPANSNNWIDKTLNRVKQLEYEDGF